MDGTSSANLVWICTSCGIHGFILGAHMNEHTLLNNVMSELTSQSPHLVCKPLLADCTSSLLY